MDVALTQYLQANDTVFSQMSNYKTWLANYRVLLVEESTVYYPIVLFIAGKHIKVACAHMPFVLVTAYPKIKVVCFPIAFVFMVALFEPLLPL